MKRKLGFLPTPTAGDGERGPESRWPRGNDPLGATAQKLMPTPRASDQNRGGGIDHGEGGPSLPGAVHSLLPTPSSWLGRRPENAYPDPEREASRQKEGDAGKRSVELPDALAKVKLLPTPSSEESDPTDDLIDEMRDAGINPDERLYLPGRKWHSQRTLSRVVPSLLPTPTHQDGIGSRRSTARTEEWTSNAGTTLTDAALESSGASTEPLSEGGKTSSGGLRLSPSFVEWLMGAPHGWTDPACPLSATEFSSRQDGFAGDES